MATGKTAMENSKEHNFNPNFTQAVIDATGPKATPRVKQLTSSLIKHLHDFARENELTVDEWMQGVELVCLHTHRGMKHHISTLAY
jgi:catechol 1,2-dioxygenase